MDRLALKAQEREALGKQVKKLRREGLIPGHVFGHKIETEHVAVKTTDFLKAYSLAGETGLIDLRIGQEKVRPVLIRDVQLDPVKGTPLHIDFYQVNLLEKVRVFVPIVLEGEEPESVRMGEAVVIQPMGEIEVEALPTALPEHIKVDISKLQQIDDAILVSELSVAEGVELLAELEAVVAKLDTAVSAETQELLEEQAAEAAAAEAAEVAETAKEGVKEGEEETEEGEGAEKAEESTVSGEEKTSQE